MPERVFLSRMYELVLLLLFSFQGVLAAGKKVGRSLGLGLGFVLFVFEGVVCAKIEGLFSFNLT